MHGPFRLSLLTQNWLPQSRPCRGLVFPFTTSLVNVTTNSDVGGVEDIQHSEGTTEESKREDLFHRQLFSLAVLAAVVRGALIVLLGFGTHLSWSDVLAGHDGVEYLSLARSIVNGGLRELPLDVWRHDVGWPLLISALGYFLPVPLAALVWILLFWAITVPLVAVLAQQHFGSSREEAIRLGAAIVFAYPAGLYYSCFALSEPFVLCAVLAAFASAGARRWGLAGLLAGLAAAGRASTIFVLPALLLAAALQQGRPRDKARDAILFLGTALVPLLSVMLWRHAVVGAHPLSLHQPHFSMPFAAFQDLFSRSLARGIYLLACVVVACVGAGKLLLLSMRRYANPVMRPAALFVGAFLLFHLSLESLAYYGKRLLLADYFDRYLVVIWPFIVIATRRWWRWPMIGLCLFLGVMFTWYWGGNYFRQVREQGAPMLEHLARPPSRK